jgi:hypothetical protein
MDLTVGILCIQFATVAFPSASCWRVAPGIDHVPHYLIRRFRSP